MRESIIGLVALSLVLVISCQDSGHDVLIKAETNANPSKLEFLSFRTIADCTGPRGTYTTLIESVGDTLIFFRQIQGSGDTIIIEKSGPVSDFGGFFAHAHHFVRQAIDPSYLMHDLRDEPQLEKGSVQLEGKTWTDYNILASFDQNSHLFQGYRMWIDTSTIIDVSFDDWLTLGSVLVPHEVLIIQDERDTFHFDYKSIEINPVISRFL